MPTDIPASPAADERDPFDRALLYRVRDERDMAAMEDLYRHFQPRLTSFLRRLTRDEGMIEEAYNDVMVKVWEKSHQYQGRSKVSSWIFSIAYRICLRMAKKQSKRDTTFMLAGDNLPELAAPEGDSPHAAVESENHTDLIAAVRALTPKQRVVVELCYFEGYSLEEIANIVHCPTNTVKTRLHHARNKMRELLEGAKLSQSGLSATAGPRS